jgi:trimeric autotransporter adhesin
MTARSSFNSFLRLTAVCATVAGLMASEHSGTVQSGGSPIPGATVTAIRGDKKFVTTTDDQGAYSFADLPDGIWTVQVESMGFATQSREVGIAADAPSPTWELKLLTLPQVRQELAPHAPPAAAPEAAPKPAQPALAHRSTSEAGGRGRPSLRQATGQGGFQRLDVKPSGNAAAGAGAGEDTSVDRNQSSDALFVNGSVSNGLNQPQQNDWNSGGRGGADGFQGPAGMDITPPGMGGPPIGGRGGGMMGGGMMGGGRGGFRQGQGGRGGRANQASFGNRRGGRRSQYNGNANFSLDNSALDARPFSLTGQDTPQAAYAKLRTSVMFGGPLKIPHLVDGTKSSFNINYQFARTRNGSTFSGLMPTMAERAGDFSHATNPATGTPVTIYDPLTGLPFPDNVIPQGSISQQAKGLLAYYPQPNYVATARYNYQIPLVGVSNQDNVNTRLNHTFNANNQINGGFGYQRSTTTTPNGFGFVDSGGMTGINATAAYIYHFTNHAIDTLRYSFSRSSTQATPYFADKLNVSQQVGISGNNQQPQNWGPTALSFSSGISGLNDGQASLNRNQTSAVSNSLIWVHGTHNLTVGGDFRRQEFNPLSLPNARGGFGFNGGLTSQYVNGVATLGTGFDFADFLLGYPDTYSLTNGQSDRYFRTSWFDAYATDEWHVSPKLTINAGLRWDYAAPVTELYGRLVNLDVAGYYSAVTPICGAPIDGCASGTGPLSGQNYGSSLIHPDRHAIAPRVAFALRPWPKHSTVIRGGYGVYYNTSVYSGFANQMAQQSPLSNTFALSNSVTSPLNMSNAFLNSPNNVTNTFAIDLNFELGYAQVWQVSIQQDLVSGLVLTGTYIGTKGTRNQQLFLPNSVPPGYVGPAPGPAGYLYEASNGNSTYEAGQIQLMRRFRSGLSGNLMYIYSHAIDDSAGLGGRGQGGTAIAQNWLDLDAERSNSSFDQRHRLTASMQFSTGQGLHGGALLSGWRGAAFKDWTFTTNMTVASGLPETPTVLNNRSVAGGTGVAGTLRSNLTGQDVADAPSGLAYNPAAFAAPAAGDWGNAGRNILSGPEQFSLNASAGRVFRVDSRRSFDMRFDAVNLLNHVVYGAWNSTVGSVQFGLPATVNNMRSFTANLRFRF